MDAVDLRYSGWAKLRDLYVASLIAFLPGGLAHAALVVNRVLPEPTVAGFFACWAAAWVPLVLVAGLWRWGGRGRMDEVGLAYAESSRGPIRELAWRDVEEIRWVGRTGVELRAGELRIRFSDDFVPNGKAWRWAGRCRGHALRAELHRRFAAGETLRFGRPASREAALLRTVVVLLAAAPVLFWLVSVMILDWVSSPVPGDRFASSRSGPAAVFLAIAGIIVAGLLLRIRASCGWVELGPAGVAVQGVTLTVCSWKDLHAMGQPNRDGLALRRADGLRFRIDRDVANFMFLEELIRSRKEG